MGCDIHMYAERATGHGYEAIPNAPVMEWRSYAVFGFLAGVRNYSDVTPISDPRGFPDDASDDVAEDYEGWGPDAHTPSYLSLEELLGFDYDASMEDRRVTRKTSYGWNGGATCNPGEGREMTFRDFLGKGYFDDLGALQKSGADRVVFWFDN